MLKIMFKFRWLPILFILSAFLSFITDGLFLLVLGVVFILVFLSLAGYMIFELKGD